MFFNRTPACPVEGFDKEWIEKALCWFSDKLGKDLIGSRKYMVPRQCDFTYLHFDSDEAIRYFIEHICDHIGLDPALIKFSIFVNDEIEFSEGLVTKNDKDDFIQLYEPGEDGKYEIGIYSKSLQYFDSTFLNLAYKLTYLKLQRDKIFNFPNSHMTEMAMVVFGFGIIQANAFVTMEQWQGNSHYGWRMRRLGCFNHRMYGYLLALLAKYREDTDTMKWQDSLCADALKCYKQAERFLDWELGNGSAINHCEGTINEEDVFIRKYFYENGKLRQLSHLKDGQQEGLTIFYHANGELWSERIYKNGVPFTVISNYNLYGDVVEKGTLKNGNGSLYIYKSDGSCACIEQYIDAQKVD